MKHFLLNRNYRPRPIFKNKGLPSARRYQPFHQFGVPSAGHNQGWKPPFSSEASSFVPPMTQQGQSPNAAYNTDRVMPTTASVPKTQKGTRRSRKKKKGFIRKMGIAISQFMIRLNFSHQFRRVMGFWGIVMVISVLTSLMVCSAILNILFYEKILRIKEYPWLPTLLMVSFEVAKIVLIYLFFDKTLDWKRKTTIYLVFVMNMVAAGGFIAEYLDGEDSKALRVEAEQDIENVFKQRKAQIAEKEKDISTWYTRMQTELNTSAGDRFKEAERQYNTLKSEKDSLLATATETYQEDLKSIEAEVAAKGSRARNKAVEALEHMTKIPYTIWVLFIGILVPFLMEMFIWTLSEQTIAWVKQKWQ